MAATGYRFNHARKDANAPGGVLNLHIVAVAASLEAATKAAGEILPAEGLTLLEQGDHVLEIAKRRGLKEGEADVM